MKRAIELMTALALLALLGACGGGEKETGSGGEASAEAAQPGELAQGVATAEAADPEQGAGWTDYETGMARAAEAGKYVLIDFWTTWCHWCKVMDKETYTDEEVRRRLAEDFVMVKVNAESPRPQGSDPATPSGRDLAREFHVGSYPTTWFVAPDGQKIAPLQGYVQPKQFLPVLDYISSGSYKDMEFQEYQNRRGEG